MKSRVLETLETISEFDGTGNEPAMLNDLFALTSIPKEEIVIKSRSILKHILHNYAAFDVVTIDTLTHRIIRTFSKDLGVSGNFEVSLDQKALTALAVDALIAKAGTDTQITEVLVNFALQKADDDKHWDITRDLNEIAMLLHNENDAKALHLLEGISLKDFKALNKSLITKIQHLEEEQNTLAKSLLEKMESAGLTESHFNRGTFFKFISNASKGIRAFSTTAAWQNSIESYNFYTKNQEQWVKDTIEGYKEEFIETFYSLRTLFYKQKLLDMFRSKLIPLSVLQLINSELKTIKGEENILLISDFNKLIASQLKEQPAAFLYERMGERYSNFFIDEFQDTSIMQWENLIPLIENALSTYSSDGSASSLLLVGDPKQAIYRWRGGEAEQFIDLSTGTKNPFTINSKISLLDTNYRSYSEIINFNNQFFTHISEFFAMPDYRDIYKKDNNQKLTSKDGGYVSIKLLEYKNVEEGNELYLPEIINTINNVIADGHQEQDICILTRSNKHGAFIAAQLAESGIKVVSSESLLAHNSTLVQFIHSFLQMTSSPDVLELRMEVLYFLSAHFNQENVDTFYKAHLHTSLQTFFDDLKEYEINFDLQEFESMSLYESLEYILRSFDLINFCDAYVLAYLDAAHNYSLHNKTGILGFIDYWELKRETISVAAPPQEDAVRIMSIHKSKGLEFPIVIYPYADSMIYSHNDHHWYPIEEDLGLFKTLMVSHTQALAETGDIGLGLYEIKKAQQQFDAMNVLYVAFTRAVKRLYIISRFRENVRNINTYSDLITEFLHKTGVWDASLRAYTYGNPTKTDSPQPISTTHLNLAFISTPKENLGIEITRQAPFLWNEEKQKAINYGILVHQLLAEVKYRSDKNEAIKQALHRGVITSDETSKIEELIDKVLDHPSLENCFKPENRVIVERPILTAMGNFHIPDRIDILEGKNCILVDYKTGAQEKKHFNQLETYKTLLEEMDFNVVSSHLVYIGDTVDVLSLK